MHLAFVPALDFMSFQCTGQPCVEMCTVFRNLETVRVRECSDPVASVVRECSDLVAEV